MSDCQYYAHTSGLSDSETWQPLSEHLENVSELAASFAEPFGCAEWAKVAGCLHDIGKACEEFQRRLQGKHPPIDHSIAGAVFADKTTIYAKDGIDEGSLLATVIAGHHLGLQDFSGDNSLAKRQAAYERGEIPRAALPDKIGISLPDADVSVCDRIANVCKKKEREAQAQQLTFGVFTLSHLLFSSLVDADWLDTERFMSPEGYQRRQMANSSQQSLRVLSSRLDSKLASFTGDTLVNQARSELLKEAQASAELPPGIFELEMPTGSGKTLTSMSFALRHALANGQKRVIYAIPFMSIVEQNAQVFRSILGTENVVEHVSSYDYGLEAEADKNLCGTEVDGWEQTKRELGLRERMLAQNWDSPVVITTNVQLFESLFSNKVSRARKVHNIANSVIVLDEAQSLPDSLLQPTLAMIETLVAIAHVSVVLCTATQPALDKVWPLKSKVTKIIAQPERFDNAFGGRVSFDVSRVFEGDAYDLDELVDELSECEQVLCVVSSRRAARAVYDALRSRMWSIEGLFHLSALMVPEHRSLVLEMVKRRLVEGLPCRVVSTQLVEAGVDLDFPVVFREVAGIDSMLQAAGRCNREGKLGKEGRVVIFDCSEFSAFRSSRPNWLSKMRALGLEGIKRSRDMGRDPFDSEAVKRFFDRRHQTGELDGSGNERIYGLITSNEASAIKERAILGHYPHETVARRYHFIDQDTVSVFVPWEQDGERLLELIENDEFSYESYPRLQRFTVSLPRYLFTEYEKVGAIRHLERFPVPVLETRDGLEQIYDSERGLMSPGEEMLDVLVV